jgi:hypothetical protein
MQAYSIAIKHMNLNISRIFFPEEYLQHVQKQEFPNKTIFVYLRRSVDMNLLTQKGRRDAAEAILKLLRHLDSGKALIHRIVENEKPASLSNILQSLEESFNKDEIQIE